MVPTGVCPAQSAICRRGRRATDSTLIGTRGNGGRREMFLRKCLDCSVLVESPVSRCAAHRFQFEAQKRARARIRYDANFKSERAVWAPVVALGVVLCARCDK